MKVTTPLITIGANRHPSIADWSISTQQLAYGAYNQISLWNPLDPQKEGITSTLKGHRDKVNAVRWVNVPVFGEEGKDEWFGEQNVLVSGGCDGTLRIWSSKSKEKEKGIGVYYSLAATIEKGEGFEGSVNYIAVLEETITGERRGMRKAGLFAVASADGLVTVWSIKGIRNEGGNDVQIQVQLLQKIHTSPKYFPLTIAMSQLPNSGDGIVLATAGSGNVIQTYVSCGEGAKEGVHFELRVTLTGHENWVRDLDFTWENEEAGNDGKRGDILLASASQDKYIRLWRIHQGRDLPAQTKGSGGQHMMGMVGRSLLSNKAHRFSLADGKEYSITFEALLMGHEDWIYTVKWNKNRSKRDGDTKTLQLLSASADNSISIWSPDEASGIWLSVTRIGEISDQKGSSTATGSAGGLWTGLWSPDGKTVAALGKTGSWRVWSYAEDSDRWIQVPATGGHTRDVTGVSWQAQGKYLLSTSLDQTTRLYAPWIESAGGKNNWHEFSRPQIHGYDINCIVSLSGSTRFVSGAEEKLLRVFEEPKSIAMLLENLCGIKETSTTKMPEAADQPVLGLSNKAILPISTSPNDGGKGSHEKDFESADPATPLSSAPSIAIAALTHPPLEDHLSRHTLWPEIEKLYGHGYEISTVAATPDGSLIATACKASSIDHAVIRIYETNNWREIKPAIQAHSLTVTRLAFNDDGKYLLSVGRDRQWAVYRRQGGETEGEIGKYEIIASSKGHTRIIFDGKWAPTTKELVFATGARDKCVKIWELENPSSTQWINNAIIKLSEAVTALAFAPVVIGGYFVLVVGLENGRLYVYRVRKGSKNEKGENGNNVDDWEVSGEEIDERITPSKAITEIQWRLGYCGFDTDGGVSLSEFAVSSEDCSVRIYRVRW